MQRYALIIFDMDGVIFEHRNFWLELHKSLGTYEEGMVLTKKYLKTDYERLVREVPGRLWKGKEAKPYFELVARLPYTPHAQETLRELRKRGLRTAIISSGPKHLALRVRDECGIDYFHTHDLVIGPDGRFTGAYVYANHDDKTEALRAFAKQAGCSLRDVVFVGHGHNDVTALRAAGLGIAYRPDDDARRAATIIIDDLQELLSLFEP